MGRVLTNSNSCEVAVNEEHPENSQHEKLKILRMTFLKILKITIYPQNIHKSNFISLRSYTDQ
jgi:hypothetical protein